MRQRKIRQIVLAVVAVLIVGTIVLPATTSAANSLLGQSTCAKPKLLGILVPWYQYLNLHQDPVTKTCSVNDFHLLPGGGHMSDLPLVLLAVVDDLLRIAGLVAVVFVIVGGIQYTTSQGNPDATAKAQSTVLNALIGLVIALFAVAFVTYLGKALG